MTPQTDDDCDIENMSAAGIPACLKCVLWNQNKQTARRGSTFNMGDDTLSVKEVFVNVSAQRILTPHLV